MKTVITRVCGILLASTLAQQATAATYGTFVFPNGYSPLGYPVTGSYTFSATNANDADDIVAVGVAAEATAPIFTSFCPTAVGTFSAPPNVQPNPAIGITVYAPGNWVVYCFGLYYVAGAHAFFLDNGETFADGSLALYGFF